MNAYEILLMLDPELPEERQDEIVTRARELLEGRGGTVEKHEPWGRRKLAYEIDHKTDGTYHLLLFRSDAETLDELSRILKITDGVMRHMAVRRPEGKNTGTADTAPPPAEPSQPPEQSEQSEPSEPSESSEQAA